MRGKVPRTVSENASRALSLRCSSTIRRHPSRCWRCCGARSLTSRRPTQLREFIDARLMIGAAAHLRNDDATRLRVGVVAAMLVGIIVARRVVRVPTIANAAFESVVDTAAEALQALLAPRYTP
ncbi:TetR/AcrR family transcriptional regulator [Amycolatopsis sp. H20-H5]|uniref:TetR/AcrR family transcriptional regulator n=1 Tax=Amycolatopsis sp. H20-H5 TaxID=3046309 RepID=UPI002DB93A55|nr:hypothetical protein [Amycolatopsis sp. H20-H5]MEC3978038.1 hypothetical protein [Amycolatopsis sp. H20-H5]